MVVLIFALCVIEVLIYRSKGGDGSIAISTPEEFMNIEFKTAQGGGQYYYKLANDLDFEGIEYVQKKSLNWCNKFCNIFDGQGFSIKNLTMSGDNSSLFGSLGAVGFEGNAYVKEENRRYATIKNLKIENINITSGNNIGAIAYNSSIGQKDASVIENVEIVSGNIGNEESVMVGGIIGKAEYTNGIKNCINRATIKGDSWVGGIAGFAKGISLADHLAYKPNELNSLTNYGNVTAYKSNSNDNYSGNVGGIIGAYCTTNNIQYIKNCKNYGNITCENNYYAGGIVGNIYFKPDSSLQFAVGNDSFISDCENNGNIVSKKYAGGILGAMGNNYRNASFTNLTNTGKITSSTDYAGGIVGNNLFTSAMFDNCKNDSATNCVEAQNYVGGICGNFGRFKNCSNTMEIKIGSNSTTQTDYAYAGGIVGCDNLNVTDYYTEISNCSNTGNISAISGNTASTFSYIGGIAGSVIKPDVNNCKNSGSVTGTSNVSGLFGYLKAYTGTKKILKCENTGKITAMGQVAATATDFDDLTTSTVVGNIGGIIGKFDYANPYSTKFTFEDCSNTGDIYIMGNVIRVGGMIGYAYTETSSAEVEDSILITNKTLDYDFYYKTGLNITYNAQMLDVIGYANVGSLTLFNDAEYAEMIEITSE